jgi:ferredoxin
MPERTIINRVSGRRVPERTPITEEITVTYKIIASSCTGCSLCEFECPNAAISMKGDTFIIDPKKCTECEGHFDHAKCDEVCPVPGTCVKV